MKLEQYLETDTKADFRSEYCYGEVFAIPAASANRARLTVQLAAMLHSHVRGSACEVFGPNLRIMASPNRVYTYSDLSVVCGGPLCSDGSLTNPTLIVEILSPSTEAYDRGKKAEMYRKIPSLQELLLIAQDVPTWNCSGGRPMAAGT